MSKYHGIECPVCNEVFAQGDDIVVCPVCGAPHHRHCYKENSGCAMESQHALGKEWRPPVRQQQEPAGAAVVECPTCGGQNPASGIFCQLCGGRLGTEYPAGFGQQNTRQPEGSFASPFAFLSSPYGGLNPEEKINGITLKEYATYIGSASPYYIPRFKLLAENSKAMTFNWAAFFLTFLYFFYRKMNRIALLFLLLFALTTVPSFYYAYEFAKEAIMQYGTLSLPLPTIITPGLTRILNVVQLMQAVQFGLSFCAGFLANRLYLKSACQRIQKIRQKKDGADTQVYIESLSRAGGVAAGIVTLVVFCVIIGYFMTSFSIGLVLLS